MPRSKPFSRGRSPLARCCFGGGVSGAKSESESEGESDSAEERVLVQKERDGFDREEMGLQLERIAPVIFLERENAMEMI